MREWFESLQERERLFVIGAGVVLVFAVIYLAVWLPLERGQKNLTADIDNWRASLVELKALQASGAARGVGRAAAAPADLNQSLVVIIDNTLRERGLYGSLQRSQPTSTNGIRVEFENAAFDDLVLWLGDLSSRYGLQVQSGSFSGSTRENDGRVNSTLTLER